LAATVFLICGNQAVFAQTTQQNKRQSDWRHQVIYFVVTDRFSDGDPTDNDLGSGAFDQNKSDSRQGGDSRGVTDKLDYISALGATAVWITPPVKNQTHSTNGNGTGYHGYWASDFSQLDPHLGSDADYKQLSLALKARNMKLVQDIVLNHTGDYFTYQRGKNNALTLKHSNQAPEQFPFSLNDPRRALDQRVAAYHWTSDVSDFQDWRQLQINQMSGLDDINTENALVRRVLRQSYARWLSEFGVDAFRVDTALYVPKTFLRDFFWSRERSSPGVNHVAQRLGKDDLMSFGEGFAIDQAYANKSSKSIARYSLPGAMAMLNLPLYGSLNDVFARGLAPAVLAHRINSMMRIHSDIHTMPSFIDNHDVDRFAAASDQQATATALVALFTLPGIPVIYYGTEQNLTVQRASMFAAGWGSGGKDHFDTSHCQFQLIKKLSELRLGQAALTEGKPKILAANQNGPGALVYKMMSRDPNDAQFLVAINTDNQTQFVPILVRALGANASTVLKSKNLTEPLIKQASLGLLPGRSFAIWKMTNESTSIAQAPSLTRLHPTATSWHLKVSGKPNTDMALIVDGKWTARRLVKANNQGTATATIKRPSHHFNRSQHHLALVPVTSDSHTGLPAGQAYEVQVRQQQAAWQSQVDYADPRGDDNGPEGSYVYPADPTWGQNRQLDIRRVQVATRGGALKLNLTMNRVTQSWAPANGFDHVAFNVFIQLPDEVALQNNLPSSAIMPLQNSVLPSGMRWHYRLRVHGWSNALFSAEGASPDNEGLATKPTAEVKVSGKNITLTFPAASLGNFPSLRGARIYITTWDYDGGYRKLEPAASSFAFSGGTIHNALIMDDTPVLTLPR
jgi:glycosidase